MINCIGMGNENNDKVQKNMSNKKWSDYQKKSYSSSHVNKWPLNKYSYVARGTIKSYRGPHLSTGLKS